MRRYLILPAALLAVAAWGGTSFGREKDAGNDSQSNASESSTNDSQSTGQNRNDRQEREEMDDAEHHAALGISMVEKDGHVRVAAVMPGSPAARAGLQVDDEIRAVGDQRIRTTDGLTEEISEQQPGVPSNCQFAAMANAARSMPAWRAHKKPADGVITDNTVRMASMARTNNMPATTSTTIAAIAKIVRTAIVLPRTILTVNRPRRRSISSCTVKATDCPTAARG